MVLYLTQLWWFKAHEFYLNKTYVGSSSVNPHLFASLVYVQIHLNIQKYFIESEKTQNAYF